jgi:hypothetical protein
MQRNMMWILPRHQLSIMVPTYFRKYVFKVSNCFRPPHVNRSLFSSVRPFPARYNYNATHSIAVFQQTFALDVEYIVGTIAFSTSITMAPAHSGTFQPLLHRSGTLRERLHSYTKRTLGAGGSINEAVSFFSGVSKRHSIHYEKCEGCTRIVST